MCAALVAGTAAFGLATGVAEAAYPGANGKIAFVTGAGGIAVVEPDGSGFKVLTTTEDAAPVWSPDGTKILFTRFSGGLRDRTSALVVMNADGSNQHELTVPRAPNDPTRGIGAATWSPDGSRIAFTRTGPDPIGPDYRVMIMDADGGPEVMVTKGFSPAWSPRGDTLAFARDEDLPGDDPLKINQGIWTSTTSGTNVRRLYNGDANLPDWAPDASRLAFYDIAPGNESNPNSTPSALSMRPDGTDLRRFATSLDSTPSVQPGPPAYSPDGRYVTYNVVHTGPSATSALVIEDIKSGAAHEVTIPVGPFPSTPDWQPLPKVNHAPDCKSVRASVTTLWPPDHKMARVRLLGGTDPDGDPVTVDLAWVGQDEPVTGRGDNTQPDAAWTRDPRVALIRRERSSRGDGRVYWIDYWVRDNHGAKCVGTVTVSVPRHKGKPAIASPFYASSVLTNGETKAHARKRRNRLHRIAPTA